MGQSIWTRLKYNVSNTSHKKGLTIFVNDWEKWIFQEKYCKISALRRLSSKCDFLVTVTPNRTRPEPVKIRHLELFKDIKFEEIGARKGLQSPDSTDHPTFIFKTTHLPRSIASIAWACFFYVFWESACNIIWVI